MATNADDWGIQLSIKHGPNLQYMTNIRGYTATEIADHAEHLAQQGTRIEKAVAEFVALGVVMGEFEVTPVQEQPASRYGGGKKTLAERNGELCEPHRLPMRYKSGTSKAGNKYELLECTSKNNPCDAIWPDKG